MSPQVVPFAIEDRRFQVSPAIERNLKTAVITVRTVPPDLGAMQMGAWGYSNFDNDDAADWVYEFETSGGAAVLAALRGVSQRGGDEYLDASEAAIALAAAEIVAAAKDGDLSKLSETARDAFATHRQSIARALDVTGTRGVVEHILRQSELKDLWEEGKDGQKWLQEMDSLLARLR